MVIFHSYVSHLPLSLVNGCFTSEDHQEVGHGFHGYVKNRQRVIYLPAMLITCLGLDPLTEASL